MKKVLSFALAGALVAAGATAQTRVDYKTLRSFGDTMNSQVGATWAVGALFPVNHPTCLAAGRVTINGAAYVGGIDVTGALPAGPDAGDLSVRYIHDMGALMVFDAAALQASAPNGQYDLVLDNLQNIGIGGMLQVSVLSDDVARFVLQRGPFTGSFNRNIDTVMGANGEAVAYSNPIRFVPVTQDHRIKLSSGAGAELNVCLGPTGQVRMIDDGNNGDWDSVCAAGGYRPETIQLGGGSRFADLVAAAVSNAPITTYNFSCSAPATLAQTQVGTAIVVNSPIVLSITMVHGAGESDRSQEFTTQTPGVVGPDNILVLGGDADFPTTDAWIEGN